MTYFKSIRLASVLIAIFNVSAKGGDHQRDPKVWNGPYFGLALGYESGRVNVYVAPLAGRSNALSNAMAFKGAGGEFLAGWGHTFDDYYLGLEAMASFYKANGKAATTFDTVAMGGSNTMIAAMRKKDAFGLAVRCGYKIHKDTLLYVKAGAILAKFNLRFANMDVDDVDGSFSKSASMRSRGFVAGFGTEVKLGYGFLGRFEVTHARYGRKTLNGNGSGFFISAGFKPQSNEVKIGLVIQIR